MMIAASAGKHHVRHPR